MENIEVKCKGTITNRKHKTRLEKTRHINHKHKFKYFKIFY